MHENRFLPRSTALLLGFILFAFNSSEVDAQVVNRNGKDAVITNSTGTELSPRSDVKVRTRSSGIYQRSPDGVYWRSEDGYRTLATSRRLPTYTVTTSSGRKYVTHLGGILWIEEPVGPSESENRTTPDIR